MQTNVRKNPAGSDIIRRLVTVIFILAGVIAIASVAAYNSYFLLLKPVTVNGAGVDKKIIVPNGANSVQIGQILDNEGVIQNAVVFRIYVSLNQFGNKLKAGEYEFNSHMSTQEVVDRLVKGETITESFTIPEGFTVKQIADKLEQKGLINRERFMDLVDHGDFKYDFLKDVPAGANRLEGYLYPDTYRITSKTTEKQIIDMMLERFSKEITPEYKAKAAEMSLTLHQAVTLASIVEREAQKNEERPKVAAVFLNRLKKNWKLESCATVQYALGTNKSRLLNQDLKVESPFNTYIHQGLPPRPIASPGKPSLDAAVNPAKVNYMFFVVFEDGKHAFSNTLQEHNRNKAAYLNRLK